MEWYEIGEAPAFDNSSWLDIKNTLPLDFPNLPYMYDGETKVTQHLTILRYICDKYAPELLGETLQEKVTVNQVIYELLDIKMMITRPAYQANLNEIKPKVIENTNERVAKLVKFMEKKSKWVLGEKLSLADLYLLEVVDYWDEFNPGGLHARLAQHRVAVLELPNINQYRNSSRFFARPFNNVMAFFKWSLI